MALFNLLKASKKSLKSALVEALKLMQIISKANCIMWAKKYKSSYANTAAKPIYTVNYAHFPRRLVTSNKLASNLEVLTNNITYVVCIYMLRQYICYTITIKTYLPCWFTSTLICSHIFVHCNILQIYIIYVHLY